MQKKNLNTKLLLTRRKPINLKKRDLLLFQKEIKRSLTPKSDKTIYGASFTNNGFITNNFFYFINYYVPEDDNKFKLYAKYLVVSIFYIKEKFKSFFLKKKYMNKEIFYIIDWHSSGYYHWINDALQKLEYIKLLFPKKKVTIVITKQLLKNNWVKKTIDAYNFEIFILKENYNFIFNKATIIGEKSISGNPNPILLNSIKKRFVKFYKKKKYSNFKYIYISRKFANRRYLTNDEKLSIFLKSKKFKIIYAEKISFIKQINLFANCKILIAQHGAGLVNMIWMKKKSKIIEIRYKNDTWNNCFFSTANALNLKYYYIKANKKPSLIFSNKSSLVFGNESIKYLSEIL